MRGIKNNEELNVSSRFDTTIIHTNKNNKFIGMAKIQRNNQIISPQIGIIKTKGNEITAIKYLIRGKNAK